MHVKPHDVPSQVAVALAGGMQAVHEVAPQLVTLVLRTQTPLHMWALELQTKPQAVPLQVDVAFAGGVHGTQEVAPHEAALVLDWQVPEQSCEPTAHAPMHDAAMAMHVPAQSFIPPGQVPPHDVPSQIAVPPPPGVGQAMHDAPQFATPVFCTHTPLQE